MTPKPCPTPSKRAFESAHAARKSIIRKRKYHRTTGIGKRFRAYLCDCGLWHLAHVTNSSNESRRRKRAA